MCLPVFLAGCQQLVVFLGDTYLSRLWCIIELFTFITMGGSLENVDVCLLAENEEEIHQLLQNMRNFDARDAKCFLKVDTDRLLTTIECGFGELEAFSKEVARILQQAVIQSGYEPGALRRVSLVST